MSNTLYDVGCGCVWGAGPLRSRSLSFREDKRELTQRGRCSRQSSKGVSEAHTQDSQERRRHFSDSGNLSGGGDHPFSMEGGVN